MLKRLQITNIQYSPKKNKNTFKHLSIQRNIYQERNASPYLVGIKDGSHFKWYQFRQTNQLSETHVVVIPALVWTHKSIIRNMLWTLVLDISSAYFEKRIWKIIRILF